MIAEPMQNQNPDHHEIEWQFDALDLRPVGRWLKDGNQNSGTREEAPSVDGGETREIRDTYLDTDDWRIYRAGYALRIRSMKGENKTEATMKRLDPDGTPGLRSRREISEKLDSPKPESLDEASGPVGKRVKALSGPKALRPLFEVETLRGTYILTLNDLHVGEIALDDTAIPLESDVADPARLKRVEVEAEPEAVHLLEPFVEHLEGECRLSPSVVSKYEAGILARGLTPPESPDFGPTGLGDSLPTGEFAFRVLREQFGIFLVHEPGTRIGEDPEELHDMRVATRRLRAAMKIFEKAVPVRTRKFREEFKWVAGSLGEVRDLDVQLERLGGWVSKTRDQEPLEALRTTLEERRDKRCRAMLRVLDSRRYARLVESFGEFLRRGPSRRARASREPIMAAAPGLVRKPYRKFRKLGDLLSEESSGEEYHDLRKKGKRLRYALEFLSVIYGNPAKDLIKSLKKLQDVLGDHQDAEVATSHLRELAVAKGRSPKLPPETVFVMGGIAERYAVRTREVRKEFPGAYGKVRGKRWKKLKKALEKHSLEDEAQGA